MKSMLLLLILTFTSCKVKLTWTDKSLNKLWSSKPNDIYECMNILDTLLSADAKNYFSQTKENAAVIEICRSLARGFIGGWHLIPQAEPENNKIKRNDLSPHLVSTKSNLSFYFNQAGINEPSEMLRIIFTCYHRKLALHSFNFQNTIDFYKSFWVSTKPDTYNQTSTDYYLSLVHDKMKAREDSILNKYYFDKRNLNDTLYISFFYEEYRFSKKPMQYEVEGVILNMDTLSNSITLQLTQIMNSKNTSVWWENKNTERKIGDVIEIKKECWYWNKEGEAKFHYW